MDEEEKAVLRWLLKHPGVIIFLMILSILAGAGIWSLLH